MSKPFRSHIRRRRGRTSGLHQTLPKQVENPKTSFLTKKHSRGTSHNRANFLGVHIDKHIGQGLIWNAYVDSVCQKLSQNIFVLRNLSNCVPHKVLRTEYFSLCYSHIQYSLLIWGHASCVSRFSGSSKKLRILAALGYRDGCKCAFVSIGYLLFHLFLFL